MPIQAPRKFVEDAQRPRKPEQGFPIPALVAKGHFFFANRERGAHSRQKTGFRPNFSLFSMHPGFTVCAKAANMRLSFGPQGQAAVVRDGEKGKT